MNPEKITAILLSILTLLALGAVLHFTGSVVIPLVTALLLSFVLSPVVEFFHKRLHVPRPLAILSVLLLLLGVGFLIGLFFYSSLITLYKEMPRYADKFSVLLRYSMEKLRLPADSISYSALTKTLGSFLFTFSRRFVDFLASLTLMVLFLIFLLLERPHIRPKMLAAFHSGLTVKITRVFDHIASQIGRFLGVKLLISFVTGSVVWVGFLFLDVDFAVIWGVLVFFFNFIPSIGSIIISLITGLFVILQYYPSWSEPVAAILLLGMLQQLMGNLVEPRLLGDQLDLSPVLIIFSLLIWGWIWGIVGMFLAVPLTVAVKIVCENIPFLNRIAILMGTGKRRKGGSDGVLGG